MLSQLELFFLISLFSVSDQCLKTLPPEEVFITSTNDMFETTTVNLCNDCDIAEITMDVDIDDFLMSVS
uniref:Uncharacterized protein n=1 Tax=Caenorhabditis japonica TaxID=281687 RepID=A0A8R1ES08_CAEJA